MRSSECRSECIWSIFLAFRLYCSVYSCNNDNFFFKKIFPSAFLVTSKRVGLPVCLTCVLPILSFSFVLAFTYDVIELSTILNFREWFDMSLFYLTTDLSTSLLTACSPYLEIVDSMSPLALGALLWKLECESTIMDPQLSCSWPASTSSASTSHSSASD